ncbi:MAG: M14 family zinc carboxypeptidase, partial [Planctomycetales bacterium]
MLRTSAGVGLLHWTALAVVMAGQDYFPENVKYDPKIPTPKSYFGFEVGERHLQHHELVGYMKRLAETSDRVALQEYARSYGGRPLIMLTITSPENHQRLGDVRALHLRLADPDESPGVSLEKLPAVVNMGYGVHGNEPSASNAAPLAAYHLAAGQGEEIAAMLSEVVVLLDPCLNPDGFERFAHWANNHRGAVANSDPNHREHREGWPS